MECLGLHRGFLPHTILNKVLTQGFQPCMCQHMLYTRCRTTEINMKKKKTKNNLYIKTFHAQTQQYT